MCLLSWQRRLLLSAMSSTAGLPHHGQDAWSDSFSQHTFPRHPKRSLVKTFKMIKCFMFSRGNVDFGIRLTFALTPMSRLLVWSLKVPRTGSDAAFLLLVVSGNPSRRPLTLDAGQQFRVRLTGVQMCDRVFSDISSAFSSTIW